MVYSSSHLVEQVVGDVAQRSTGAQASELLLHAEESKYKNGTFSIALRASDAREASLENSCGRECL
jgi:hypothetical protein